ncbi:hypothetical protein SAMN05444266_101615 [Chitinophaga jiangningensis]|uniref:Sigma-70, region 4 n=1 Tax=Chitinophaga jiangningensis TaxID=1419482 RepID=A0A1M6WGG4_9BACT|nr:hypothetical protein SAMN05444266_101615 [Chitinophaga jiangningensis]
MMTDLDKKLQEMAMTNWEQFVHLIGEDALTAAKVCLLRQNNASYGKISQKLGITEKQVRGRCDKCN